MSDSGVPESKNWRHDMRSSLNGIICMGSLLEDTDLNGEQQDLLRHMLDSARKALVALEEKDRPGNIPGSYADKDLPFLQSSNRLRILVAEDDEINRLYLSTILKRQNWDIFQVVDGFQAVESCRGNSFNIILMDVSMPGLDGIQAAQKIRDAGTTCPIIVITAHSLLDFQEDLINSCIDEVLRKPFDEEKLIQTINKLTDREIS